LGEEGWRKGSLNWAATKNWAAIKKCRVTLVVVVVVVVVGSSTLELLVLDAP